MIKRARRFAANLFLGGVAAVHVAAAAGFALGSWPLGIAADGLDLLALFDAALALGLLATRAGRRAGAALAAAAAACAGLAWGPGFALSPDPSWGRWAGRAASSAEAGVEREPAPALKTRLLQANVEAMGVRAAAVAGLDFDVAAIAEWQPGDDMEWARQRGLSLVSFDARTGDAALFSRWPALAQGCLADASGFCQARWALLDAPGGPLRVVAVHTRSPQAGWRARARDEFMPRMAAQVEAWPAGEPIVAAGDFNATWATRSMRGFAARGSWNGGERRAPTWPSFAARWGAGFRIDHVLAARGARVVSHRTFDSGYSDHQWGLAEIEIPARAPGARAAASR